MQLTAGGYQRATTPDRRHLIAAPALVALLLASPLLTACHSNKTAEKDVTITACNADPGGGRPTADGTVVNHSSKASTYILSVQFIDSSGNKVTDGGATLGKVLSGATSIFHAQGVTGGKGPFTCKVGSVQRTVAP